MTEKILKSLALLANTVAKIYYRMVLSLGGYGYENIDQKLLIKLHTAKNIFDQYYNL